MKLDYGKTIRIGFAFLSICAFWQLYNGVIPLVLTNTFHMNEAYSGMIMAMDNILALFLLPLFGTLSDRCKSPLGSRRPFILFGTIAAVILMMIVPLLDNLYAANPSDFKRILFVVFLGLLLIAMGTYRSPAVALMPDLTPKPLRSRANAVINLMGALGGIIYLIIAAVLYSSSRIAGLDHVNYMPLFIIVACIMLLALGIVMLTVDEPALRKEVLEYEESHPEEDLTREDETGREELPPEVKKSLILLLISIALWFIAYNAVETWFTTYANRMWGMPLGNASLCLTIATVGAIVSYMPVASIAERFGRKKTIMGGVILMIIAFVISFLFTLLSRSFHPLLYGIFAMIGMGWAAINVNSLPMVVEMCRMSDIGKYTGTYYTFSMSAQIITPVLAGWLMNHVGYQILFPYAALFMAAAFITMRLVRHGDTRVIDVKGLDLFDNYD